MSRYCPITGETVLYIECLDCSRICEKIKEPCELAILSNDAIEEIKAASRKTRLNVHNWKDGSIDKAWRMFSVDNGFGFGMPVSNESISRFFNWLRDQSE